MDEHRRYDGLADWYDQEIRRLDVTAAALQSLTALLGPGPGKCLDLGCGTAGEEDYPILLSVSAQRHGNA